MLSSHSILRFISVCLSRRVLIKQSLKKLHLSYMVRVVRTKETTMRRPKGSPDLIVRLQMVLAARTNHQKNRPVTDSFLAEVVGKKPAAITKMLKENPALDELLSPEGYCNGHEPETEALEQTFDQLIRLLGVSDVLHINHEQPVADAPVEVSAEVIETPASPTAVADGHTALALAATDCAVITQPLPEPEAERVEEVAREELDVPTPAVVTKEPVVMIAPAPQPPCPSPVKTLERPLVANPLTAAVRESRTVVVNDSPPEIRPLRSHQPPKQSAFPVSRNQFFGADEPGWKQSVRYSRELTVTYWNPRVLRLACGKVSAGKYLQLLADRQLEFQRKGQEKPPYLPSSKELEEFITSLKTPA